jgi:hypothetical protein
VSAQIELRIGSEFVGYRIEGLIGRGGMGVVYRAYDLRLKRTVALKLMAPELALDERFRERFSREAELAMSLEHPNVVPIHDAGDIDGRLYLAMRYVEGRDLGVLLEAEGALEPAHAVAICGQVAQALDAAHARGLVHRDVKPSNVLLDENEHVYLADFGLTRRLDERSAPGEHGRSMGTPAYLAPEQIEGRPIDGRADVYSLGCLLYQCLTGEIPFARDSRLAVAWAHLEEEPPRASERRSGLPDAIDTVIRKAMAKAPEGRYTTCAALITAAEEALALRRPPALRRHKLLLSAVLACLVVFAAVMGAALATRSAGTTGRGAPAVKADTLVRIDPATNRVSAVTDVGHRPSATAVGGRSVWVYSDSPPSVSEIDAATREVRHTTRLLAAAPTEQDTFAGPVLAADPAGAWVVGVDGRDRPLLTRVLSGGRGTHAYTLDGKPRAVAVGYDAIWVVVHRAHESDVLRIDPTTGAVTAHTRFHESGTIDGLAAGLGGIWVVAPSSGTLYRINPRSATVTGRIDLGERASRPFVVFGYIWVDLSAHPGGDTVIVEPETPSVVDHLGCCPPQRGYSTAGFGSIWDYDKTIGTVVRWDGQTHQVADNIHVTDAPFYGGRCLTSIAAGAGAIWVTVVAHSSEYTCKP